MGLGDKRAAVRLVPPCDQRRWAESRRRRPELSIARNPESRMHEKAASSRKDRTEAEQLAERRELRLLARVGAPVVP